MLLRGGVGRRDQEDEIGRAVLGPEVDAGLESGEGERRLGHGAALGVRDGDAAGQARLVGLLALPGVGGESGRVGRATGRRDARRERVDDGSLVGADRLVETDECRRDDL